MAAACTGIPEPLVGLTREVAVQRVSFGHGHVAWRGFGEGDPLVLLHGGHGSWLHWARNVAALARTHRVWVPDLPGYGRSDKPAAPTLDSLVDATMRTLDTLVGIGRPVKLAGFSFGGLAAARLAQRRGGVTHLALVGPGGSASTRRPRGELRTWRGLQVDGEAWNAVMRHNLLVHMLHEPASIDEAAIHIHGQSCLHARFHSKGISLQGGLAAAVEGFRGLLLLVCGEHDVTLTPGEVVERLMQNRPDGRAHTIPGAGHWVQFESAERVNHLLARWFGSR